MASYRYERDITPGDLAPRREKQYTRRERWANWWDYNLKWVLIIGIAVAFVVAVILNTVLPSEEHFLSAPKEAPAADAE